MQEFQCRFRDFLRCGNTIMRENIGDAFDYPFCEACQVKEAYCECCRKIDPDEKITRLDNGQHR